MREFRLEMDDGFSVAAAAFDAERPNAAVQIVHGAKEHKERYYPFAEYLCSLGLTVWLSDNRGHGGSVGGRYPLGYMDDWARLVGDQAEITRRIRAEMPGKPLCLYGHSFGSMLARCYLQEHDAEIDSLLLSGTVNYLRLSGLGVALGSLLTMVDGGHAHTRFLQKNGEWEDVSWVSSDEDVMRAYRSDPLCTGYKYPNSSILTMWKADRQLHRFGCYPCRNPGLKILIISGADDPMTGGEKGLADSAASLRRIGYTEVRSLVYPGLKHEIVCCRGNEQVLADVRAFLTGD